MVKVVYTGPDEVHFRQGWQDKVIHFVPENNWTVEVDRETMYALIQEERVGEYMKIEGDPKAIPRSTFTNPGIRQAGDPIVSDENMVVASDDEAKIVSVDAVLNDQILDQPQITPEAPATVDDATPEVPVETAPEMTPDAKPNLDDLLNIEDPQKIIAEVSTDTAVQSALS